MKGVGLYQKPWYIHIPGNQVGHGRTHNDQVGPMIRPQPRILNHSKL